MKLYLCTTNDNTATLETFFEKWLLECGELSNEQKLDLLDTFTGMKAAVLGYSGKTKNAVHTIMNSASDYYQNAAHSTRYIYLHRAYANAALYFQALTVYNAGDI